MNKLFKFIILFVSIIGTIASVSGSVSEFTFNPDKPVVGDVITIKGTASQNEVIKPAITLNTDIEVKGDNKYNFPINGIEVPTKKNTFTIQAKNVKNLNVKVEKYGLSWTLKKDAISGIATISQGNVPDWTYNIRLFGTANPGVSSVPITVTAITTSSEIKTNDNGKFIYEYSTSKLLPGTYLLTIGGISKEIKLLSKKEKEDRDKEDRENKDKSDKNENIIREKDTKKFEVTSSQTPKITGNIEITPNITEEPETTAVKEPKSTPSETKEIPAKEESENKLKSRYGLSRILDFFSFLK